MPSRFAFFSEADHIKTRYKVENVDEIELYEYYNVKPTNRTTGVIIENGKRKLVRLRWGFAGGKKFFKARAETAHESQLFGKAFLERRCLIIANGFFEWDKVDENNSIPYYFTMKDKESFGIAGLYNSFFDEEDQIQKYTVAIITVEPNNTVGEIFHRMPAILKEENEEAWLNPSTDQETVKTLLHSYPDEEMEKWEVDPLPARGDNGPDTIKKATKSTSLDEFF